MTQNFAALDPVTLGPQLELRDGGMLLTYDTTGTTVARHARANQGVATGQHFWECVVYGDQALVADTAVVGLVLAGTANTTAPGVSASTVGYRPGDGTCWQGGAVVATVATAPLRTVIGVALNLAAPTRTLTVYVNRLAVHTFTLAAGQTWYPAHTVCGAVAYGHFMFVNYGFRLFETASPAGFRQGVYTTSQPFSTMRVASEDWITPHDAAEPNIPYAGHVRNPDQFGIEKGVTFWPWGQSGSSFSFGELEIQDDGTYEALALKQPRGARVLLKIVDRDDPTAAPVSIGGAIFVQANESGPDAMRIRLRDPLEQLDVGLRRRYYLPYVIDGSANRLMPISLGACRNIEPILIDAPRRTYGMHDGPLTQIVAIRDKGDKLDPLAAPPDWSVTSDRRGVELQTEAQGKVSADVSSSGAATIVGAPNIDAVAGFGTMATNVSGMPDQWFTIAAGMFHATASHVATGGGRLSVQTTGIIPASILVSWDVRFRNVPSQRLWVPIRKGCYYRMTYRISSSYWPTTVGFGQCAAGWRIRGAGESGDAGGTTTHLIAGEYTIDFRASCDGTLAWYGYGNIDPANNGGSTGPWFVEIDDVVCLLKSADTPDRLSGFGHFIAALTNWTPLTISAGCSVAYGTVTSSDYPAGLGVMVMTIAAGAAKVAQDSYQVAGSAMLAGRSYRVALRLDGSTSNARVNIVARNTATSAMTTLTTLSASTLEATVVVGADSWLVLEGFTADAAVGTAKVSLVRCFDVTDQLAESSTTAPLSGISLAEYCRHVIEDRAGLSAGSWVASDAAAIDTATGYVFGVHVRETITGRGLLSAPLDTYTAALTTDNLDRIRIARLIAPEAEPDGAIVWEINQLNAPERPEVTLDEAPGLTCRAGARRNWTLHTDSDFVTDFDPITGIDAASRTRFKRVSQFIVSSAKPLADLYAAARNRDPIDFLSDLQIHAQTELDRVVSMYSKPRGFWRVVAYYDGTPPLVRPGVVVRVTWPRPGLETGLKLLVSRARHVATAQMVDMTLWGLRSNR